MIKLVKTDTKIEELETIVPKKEEVNTPSITQSPNLKAQKTYGHFTIRPTVVDAKVYKLKSAFVKNSVFVTLSYVREDEKVFPIEIFINSKDLTKAPEYVMLTRLVSAIFRRATDPSFILEELRGIFDPSGGSYKQGKYYHSFYAEIADIIEKFFFDIGILDAPVQHPVSDNGELEMPDIPVIDENELMNSAFRICPDCQERTLKTENGCDTCISPECGYSKCDK